METTQILSSWEETARISRDILQRSIQTQWLLDPLELPAGNLVHLNNAVEKSQILTAEEITMTNQGIEGLLQNYRAGKWTAEAVTVAFLKRATIGHQLFNFATEFLAESALEAARSLDTFFRETGRLHGPLHGVPVSVKEHIAIGGHICHASFVSKVSNVATEDAHIVTLLRRAGAIIHVRTNQPQSIMHLDCENNITGKTSNPHHPLLSPGGSSGGEGASLAFGCSVLGVGTDIGGWVRVPASFCNVHSFKPTALRNPSLGLVGAMGGQESIRGCVGPMGRSLADLISFEKAMLDQEPWDTETILVPLPWRSVQISKENIVIGIMYDDGEVKPHPPVTRAIREAEACLRAAGVKVATWKPYKHQWGWEILKRLYFADSGARVRAALEASGEPLLPLTEYILNECADAPKSIPENWDCNLAREAFRREYHAEMKSAGVDAILCPSYVGAGVLQGQAKYWNYTAIWNILDQPAATFPSCTRVEKEIDVVDTDYEPRSEADRREWNAYDPELFDGLTVSLQLVGKHHRDEELLATARIIETLLKDSNKPMTSRL